MPGVKLKPEDAVCDCSASVGDGLPDAVTVNAVVTPDVAPYGPVPLVNEGGVPPPAT